MLPVHHNGPLTILPQYVQKEFGVPRLGLAVEHGGMMCLFSNVAFALSFFRGKSVKKTAKKVAKCLDRQALLNSDDGGVTLGDLARAIRNAYNIEMYAERIKLEDVGNRISQGIPVLSIAGGGDFHRLDYGNGFVKEAEVQAASSVLSRARDGGYLHSFTTIGVDRDDHLLILRDSRDNYSFKGYMKVPMSYLYDRPETMVFVALRFEYNDN